MPGLSLQTHCFSEIFLLLSFAVATIFRDNCQQIISEQRSKEKKDKDEEQVYWTSKTNTEIFLHFAEYRREKNV